MWRLCQWGVFILEAAYSTRTAKSVSQTLVEIMCSDGPAFPECDRSVWSTVDRSCREQAQDSVSNPILRVCEATLLECLSQLWESDCTNPAAVWLGCVRTVHVPPRNAVRTLAVLHTGVLVFHTCGRWTQTPVSHDQRAVFSLLGYEFDALARRDLSKWVLATECFPGQWWELPEMECFPLGWNLSSWVFFLKTYKALKLSFYK